MSLRVVTVPYRPELGRFDDAELRSLTEWGNVASHQHDLVDAAGEPKLVFVLELRAVALRTGFPAVRGREVAVHDGLGARSGGSRRGYEDREQGGGRRGRDFERVAIRKATSAALLTLPTNPGGAPRTHRGPAPGRFPARLLGLFP